MSAAVAAAAAMKEMLTKNRKNPCLQFVQRLAVKDVTSELGRPTRHGGEGWGRWTRGVGGREGGEGGGRVSGGTWPATHTHTLTPSVSQASAR